MAFPVILADSILRDTGATITASSTDTGFSDDDVADYRPWKIWKSGTLVTGITIDIDLGADTGTADTLGLVNHNLLSEGGTIKILADTAAGPNPPTTERLAAYTPVYGDVELKTFTLASNLRRWRVVLEKGGNFTNKPFIGEMFIGQRITLPEYVAPDTDPYFRQTEASAEHSEGGHYLGAILRGQSHRQTLAVGPTGIARSFHTSDLDSFIHDHLMRMRPFFFQIDSDDATFKRPFYLVKTPDGSVGRAAVNGVWSRLGFSVPVAEAWMEAA